jgi:predicted HTH transcriptional regulator
MTIIIFLVGLLLGVGSGVLIGRRARAVSPDLFTEDDMESDPRLTAAHVALRQRTERRLARIMAQAQTDGRITNNGAEELFCISDRTASVYLSELTKRGDLERQGAGRGTFYTPK